MAFKERLNSVLAEYRDAFELLNSTAISEFSKEILNSNRVFIVAAGRTRCVTEMFAMRLSQAGITTYMVGEVTTPVARKDDLLIAASGSGETKSVLTLVERAKEGGVKIFSLTNSSESRLSKISDMTLLTPKKPINSKQILGSFSETCLLLILDQAIECILKDSGKTEDDLASNHANIE